MEYIVVEHFKDITYLLEDSATYNVKRYPVLIIAQLASKELHNGIVVPLSSSLIKVLEEAYAYTKKCRDIVPDTENVVNKIGMLLNKDIVV